jgi:hypothetical protein
MKIILKILEGLLTCFAYLDDKSILEILILKFKTNKNFLMFFNYPKISLN